MMAITYGERLLLLAVEGALLQGGPEVVSALGLRRLHVVEGLAEEPCRPHRAVVDGLADLGLDQPDHGANQWARRVVLATVAPGVAHVADLGLVEVRELVLLGLRAEAQLVDMVDDLAQVVAALDPVPDLAEDLADLVLDRVGPGGLLFEAV